MKNLLRYIGFGMLSVLLLIPVGCTEFEEFKSSVLDEPVTLGLTKGTVKDSSAVVNVVNPSNGYITLGIMKKPATDSTFDAEAFFKQNVSGFKFVTVKCTANKAVAINFGSLEQYTDYVIYGVSSNADGVLGDPVKLTFKTGDTHAPNLVSTTPDFDGSLGAVLSTNGEITLNFDEPVVYDNTKNIKYEAYNDGIVSEHASVHVSVDGTAVTIKSDSTFRNREILFISWEKGAFKDQSGNEVDAMESNIDSEGYPYGLYMRVLAKNFVPTAVSPATTDTVTAAQLSSIVLTFAEKVGGFNTSYNNGDVDPATITYTDEEGSTTKKLAKSAYAFSGKTVTITLPIVPASGQTVALSINKATFKVGISNPNDAIAETWIVK